MLPTLDVESCASILVSLSSSRLDWIMPWPFDLLCCLQVVCCMLEVGEVDNSLLTCNKWCNAAGMGGQYSLALRQDDFTQKRLLKTLRSLLVPVPRHIKDWSERSPGLCPFLGQVASSFSYVQISPGFLLESFSTRGGILCTVRGQLVAALGRVRHVLRLPGRGRSRGVKPVCRC